MDKSIIRQSLGCIQNCIQILRQPRTGTFINGNIIDFGYCDNENDIYRYKSAEFDVIRFDELTHFTKGMYIYFISYLRGGNGYPNR